ncbi:hypothetical protein BJV82DRAFT_665764 [Fennellomyces sp. T-0311]|nr:hypothetical protein BJV82DRAFT_665764 [Fennellomyces sp. T-0311]
MNKTTLTIADPSTIDFISQLPFELVPQVMQYSGTDELLKCMTVSKNWTNRLRACPELWTKTALGHDLDVHPSRLSALACVAHYVVEIELSYMQDLYEELLDLFSSKVFIRLRSLVLDNCRIPVDIGIGSLLLPVSDTLEKLEILFDPLVTQHPRVPIGQVLSLCPKLQYFNYVHDTPSPCLGSMTMPCSLKHLELELRDISDTAVERVLGQCPDLRVLSLSQCSPSALAIVRRSCPKLECLSFNHCYSIQNRILGSRHIKKSGLRDLTIAVEDMDDLCLLLTEHRDTLERLDIALVLPPNEQDQLACQAIDILPHLKALEISYNNADVLITLLRKVPQLENLTLSTCDLESEELIETIQQLTNLRELSIHDDCHASQNDIIELLSAFAEPGRQLESIKFATCDFIDDAILHVLPSIRTLREVDIGWSDAITEQGVQYLQQNLHIESLSVGKLDSASNIDILWSSRKTRTHIDTTSTELLDSSDNINPYRDFHQEFM